MKERLFVFLMIGLCIAGMVYAAGTGAGQSGTQEPGTAGGASAETGQGTGTGTQTATETETQNQGENSQIQTQQQTETNNPGTGAQVQTQQQTQVQSGSYTTENGNQVQVQQQTNNRIQLRSGEASAETSMQMTQQQTQTGTKLQVQLSNGQNAEVKVMPDTASQRAIEQLQLKNCVAEEGCSIELKEVGQGDQVRAAYEVKAQKQVKVLGLFQAKMQVQAQIDSENGETIRTNRPWWAFLATQ